MLLDAATARRDNNCALILDEIATVSGWRRIMTPQSSFNRLRALLHLLAQSVCEKKIQDHFAAAAGTLTSTLGKAICKLGNPKMGTSGTVP
mmetsp:Transcript_4073/g.11097  ORF Transcript_4073/g.11097 Transcript_4073/m.11097 type:complete len:91 (+) Transcript_4073:790-1062(+)